MDLRKLRTILIGGVCFCLHIGEQYPEGSYLRIGCKGHSLSYWMENFEQIGKQSGYSEQEIKEYGNQIASLNELNKGD